MAIGKDTVVTKIGNKKGIHYRPHRTDPDNYVVVKVYLTYPDKNEKQTRKILTDYLSDLGESKAKITKGSIKWVAIIPKDALDKKAKRRSKASTSSSTSTSQKTKAKSKSKAKGSSSSQAKEKKYMLDMPGQKQKQYVGQSSSSSASGLQWKPSGKYSLEWVDIVAERLEG